MSTKILPWLHKYIYFFATLLFSWSLHSVRGEREWLLDFWEREREWLNPFPNFGIGNGNGNRIPEICEREREWKNAFPNFGNGNGNEKFIPNFREREWEVGIPGNGRERERECREKNQLNFRFCSKIRKSLIAAFSSQTYQQLVCIAL